MFSEMKMIKLKLRVVIILVLSPVCFGFPFVNDSKLETDDLNITEINDLEKFVDVINFYRLVRSDVEDFSQFHDHDSDEELQGRGPNCGRCNRPKIHDPKYLARLELPSRIPAGRKPAKPVSGYKVSAGSRRGTLTHIPEHKEKKRVHWAEKVGASVEGGLYLSVEDAIEYEGGIVVPVYDSAILKSKEYRKYKRTKDLLAWADRVEEKTEDPCVIYAICQIGLRPNDFGRLGEDLRRLIRRPTVYLTNIIRRYATAINFQLGSINFGACKDEFQACLISSDKQHLVDIGFPLRGIFTM